MNFNFGTIMKAREGWNTFKTNHPKFPEFLHAAADKGVQEGTTVDICVAQPDGSSVKTHICLRASDIEVFNALKELL